MPIEWKFRIEDILHSIDKIDEYISNLNFDEFKKNEMIVDAVIRKLEIIGEAAGHIPKEIRDQHPEIPWSTMRGIRNILIHEYFGVDNVIVWETVQNELPDLKQKMKQLL